MNAKRLLGLMALCLLWSATAVRAGEIDTLVNSLAEKGIITYGEAQTILTEGR